MKNSRAIQFNLIKKSVFKVLRDFDVPKRIAAVTAAVMIEGDLRGYKNHGIERTFEIINGIEKKTINPLAQHLVLKDFQAIKIIDGQYGLGHFFARQSMKEAIKRAKHYGVGVCANINSSHIGILSYYSELASHSGCIGITMSTSSPCVVLGKSGKKILGTNPISFSLPFYPFHITGDFSTAMISRGKILEYLHKKYKFDKYFGIDKNNKPTKDPQSLLEGGIYSMDGSIKGTLLSLLISVLCGHLIGGDINANVKGTRFTDHHPNKGDFFIAFDISKFTSLDKFWDQTFALAQMIETSGSDFGIPGKRSFACKQHNLDKGLVISQNMLTLFKNHNINFS